MPLPRKIRKIDDTLTKGETTGAQQEGVIRFVVEKMLTVEDGQYSSQVEVGGVCWRAFVSKELNDETNEMLSVYLCCMVDQSTQWNIDVDAEFTLLAHSGNGEKQTFKNKFAFRPDHEELGEDLLEWGEFINKEKGFFIDGKATFEIQFSISEMNGIRNVPHVDFTDPNDPRHDVTLEISGKKVYASKQFLSLHSSVFSSMFYDYPAVKSKTEVKLNDVDIEEFLEMLRVIYPSSKRVTDESATYLLKLGFRFQIKLLLDLTEKHLLLSTVPDCASKLLLSDQYGLSKLKDHCVAQINKMKNANSVETADGEKKAANETSSGFIRFEIKNFSDLTSSGMFSPTIQVHGMPWSLFAKKDDSSALCLYLKHRKSYSNLWSIHASVEFSLVHKDGNNLTKSFAATFNHEHESLGLDIISWEDLRDEDKGFIDNDTIFLEARFKLSKFIGIRIYSFDFADPNDPRQDVALIIDEQKIYVSKQILAVHSPFFNSIFYGDFVEKNQKEIELKDVDRKEFIDMLNIIYPSHANITDANAEYLLKLGDRFQIKVVIDQVEQFLRTSTKLTVPDKLKLSDQYRLVYLQDYCLGTFKSGKDIKNIKNTEGYKTLSDKAKSALMDRMMKLPD